MPSPYEPEGPQGLGKRKLSDPASDVNRRHVTRSGLRSRRRAPEWLRKTLLLTPELADFVLTALPRAPARVLEVGCGRGDLAKTIAAAGYGVLAIDPKAPEGGIFRRTKLEDLDEPEPFDAAVARYSLHHVDNLSRALDRLAGSLQPPGILVVEEFGWDLVDQPTAGWYRQHQETPTPDSLADWRAEHEGLHGYAEMQAALDARFSERFFEWRPYLYRCLGSDDEVEAREQDAIAQGRIQAIGFRYVGACRLATLSV